MRQVQHRYAIRVEWTGNRGEGTRDYRAYDRSHEISSPGKPVIPGSSDPAFRGDPARYNPEDLLVASLSACHMLWYLHLCTDAGIVVTAYVGHATGIMVERGDGAHFEEVVLRPTVTVRAGTDLVLSEQLHETAHRMCFIANSVNFPVRCKPRMEVAGSRGGDGCDRSAAPGLDPS